MTVVWTIGLAEVTLMFTWKDERSMSSLTTEIQPSGSGEIGCLTGASPVASSTGSKASFSVIANGSAKCTVEECSHARMAAYITTTSI